MCLTGSFFVLKINIFNTKKMYLREFKLLLTGSISENILHLIIVFNEPSFFLFPVGVVEWQDYDTAT